MLLSSNLQATASLLRVSDVEFSDQVKTICMKFSPVTAMSTITINHVFASNYADTPLRLSTLILHELFHHMLHHYALYSNDVISGYGQDVLINGLICRLSPQFQQLFNDLYTKTEFPSMMLRPMANFKRIENEDIRELARSIHKHIYRKTNHGMLQYYEVNDSDPDNVTVDDICDMFDRVKKMQKDIQEDNLHLSKPIMETLGGLQESWWEDNTDKLLGSHDLQEDQLDVQEEEYASLLDSLTQDIGCNSNASSLFKKSFKIEESAAPEELSEAFQVALNEQVMRLKEIVKGVCGDKKSDRSVIPIHLGRRELLLISQGINPIFYPAASSGDVSGDVYVYVDVSGSMGDQAKFILMLLTAFKQQISSQFYQFSTEIAEVNFVEFVDNYERTGEVFVKTTGGTSFDPIFAHAQQSGNKKILIITDGIASVSEEMQYFAQSIETFVVFTYKHQEDPLNNLSEQTWVMPNIKGV